MQPVRPKMKKIILAGFVACMSLFGSSSGAPVPRHRAAHPAESATASLPASSPLASAPGSSPTTTRSAGANGPTTSSRNPSSSSSSPPPSSSPSSRGSPTASPPRPSSFSLGLNLGQFDYAAAGIARRVSRVFVKRMSAGSSRSMGSARSTQVVQVVQKGGGEEGDRTATTAMTTNLVPVVEAGSASSLNFVDEEEEERRRVPVPIPVLGPRAAGQLDNEGHNTEHTEPGMLRSTKESESEEMVTPDIRACRWGCI
ncbi:hypothetical protein C8R41DRAFT_479823 [Lentinula lateritia]|uniref:Uncharacterized protein n=1 Tax=Lentinula lateritia TaxID=40482 RepID=A0ABQ8VYI1_9AGAR|nr:hypothetical protein C8R41DRAFT_479823 [Lentinula lateritia]